MKIYGNVGTGERGDVRQIAEPMPDLHDGQLAAIPLALLTPDPLNPREVVQVGTLADSMRAQGLIQPVVVVPNETRAGHWWVTAGTRRLTAARALMWEAIACYVRLGLAEDDRLSIMLVENRERSGLNPIEEARALRALQNRGKTMSEMERSVGRSRPWIHERLSLLDLPPEDQQRIIDGLMGVTSGRARAASLAGRARPRKVGAERHFNDTHSLAENARNRCRQERHPKHHQIRGTDACGECWETVIRAAERQQINLHVFDGSPCPTCGGTVMTRSLTGAPTENR